MLKGLLKRVREDEGFTLIELMVVVLIIGILVAIALPTFLGARNRANDKAAQSGLRNALAAAKTCFTDNDGYAWDSDDNGSIDAYCDDTVLGTIETSLQFVDEASSSNDPGSISVYPAPNAPGDVMQFGAAAFSKSQMCFYIYDDVATGGGGTTYSSDTSDGTDCLGQDAAAGQTSW